MVLNVLIYVAILPLAVAAGTTILCRRLRVLPRAMWAAGAGLGYLAGQFGLAGRADPARALSSFLRPHEAVDWLPHAILLVLGITIVANHAPRIWQRFAVFLASMLTIGLPLRLLAGSAYVTQRWALLEKVSYFVLLSATLGLTWLVLGAARDDEHPRLRPSLTMLVAAGAAVVVALSGVFVYGQLCGALAAALAGTAIASWFSPAGYASTQSRLPLADPGNYLRGFDGAAGILMVSLGGLILLSCFYAKLTPTNAALLFLSLMMAGGRQPAFVSMWQPWQQGTFRAGLCLLPLAIALARSFAAGQSGMSPYAI